MSGRSKRPVHARSSVLALIALGLAGTAGCGQSGPLTLPSRHAETAGAPTGQQSQDSGKKKDKDKSGSSANGR